MTLNLASEEGRAVFLRMAERADIVAQNFRVGVVERLGMDYAAVRQRNTRIIYVSISGFGPKGPDATDGVYDHLGQARSGFLKLMALPGGEIRFQAIGALADQMGAVYAAHAVLCAVVARERYGVGQHVQTSQLGAMMVLQALAINNHWHSGQSRPPVGRKQSGNPLYNVYSCGDGRWVSLGGVQSERYWTLFCRAIGMPELEHDPRFATREARAANCTPLIEILDAWFGARRRDDCLRLLKAAGMLCAPVQDYDELSRDPQVLENGYLAEVTHPTHGTLRQVGIPATLSETPGAIRTAAPQFGEHTEEVLLEYGYTWEQIAKFRERGVI
jgi:crotonobetainyl-CoA:carnitine CoA-transferase CaiB-like acyl-CoA transferase